MKLICSKCEAESEQTLAIWPKHYEYICSRCGQLLHGDIQLTAGAVGGVSSFARRFVLCRCPKGKPNAAPFYESESYARAKASRAGFHEKKA